MYTNATVVASGAPSSSPTSSPRSHNFLVRQSPPTHALAIPPSPCTPPPQPPTSQLPVWPESPVLDLGFPSPPGLPRRLPPSPLPLKETRTLPKTPDSPVKPLPLPFASQPPPTVPPRSKLRPPPVKISTEIHRPQQIILLTGAASKGCESSTTPPEHSRSSSIASLLISPLPTPPRSQSPSNASPSPSRPLPKHSHSSSIASSLIISPMPTPPPLSPTSPSSGVEPCVRPSAPEPQLDMTALRSRILQYGDLNSGDEAPETEASLRTRARSDDDIANCAVPDAEFGWQEEPRSPPSRLSFRPTTEFVLAPMNNEEAEEDEIFSIYAHFSSTYTFGSPSQNPRRMRSIRRGNSRSTRRSVATSMMSVYSQASFSPEDATDLPPVPVLPWTLRGDVVGDVAEEMLTGTSVGGMPINAPEHAYSCSRGDSRALGSALSGGTPIKAEVGVESQPLSNSRQGGEFAATTLYTASPHADDWRGLLSARDVKDKHRTSSNISVVADAILAVEHSAADASSSTVSDARSVTTYTSLDSTSTASPAAAAQWLSPNRRQRTIRVQPSSPRHRSNHQPPSSPSANFVFDVEPEKQAGLSPAGGPEVKPGWGTRAGFRGMKNRVSVLKSRLVSLTLAPRDRPPLPSPGPSPASASPGTSASYSGSSSSTSSAGSIGVETSSLTSASSWSQGDLLPRWQTSAIRVTPRSRLDIPLGMGSAALGNRALSHQLLMPNL